MATAKKETAAKATKAAEKETKTAAKAVKETKTAAKAEEKKAPAKKTAPKKTAPKKTAPKKAETKVGFFVEFGGVQVSVDKVIEDVKATYGKDAKEISVYLKPEESKAYFVADGEEKEMDVYFV